MEAEEEEEEVVVEEEEESRGGLTLGREGSPWGRQGS